MPQKEVYLDRTHPSYTRSERQCAPLYRRSSKKDEQKSHDDHQQDERVRHLENGHDHNPYAHGSSADHHDQHNWLKIQALTQVQLSVVVGKLQTSLDVQTHHQV